MNYKKLITRRSFFLTSFPFLISKFVVVNDFCDYTIPQPKGPFYKTPKLLKNLDMTNNGKAKGEVIKISGKIMNTSCNPYKNAILDVWQANYYGKYNHNNDSSFLNLDKNFNGYGRIITDNEGNYKITTIYPGSYKVFDKFTRTPHIHFLVTIPNKTFSTQMYFLKEKQNKNDPILSNTKNSSNLIVPLRTSIKSEIKTSKFNIII